MLQREMHLLSDDSDDSHQIDLPITIVTFGSFTEQNSEHDLDPCWDELHSTRLHAAMNIYSDSPGTGMCVGVSGLLMTQSRHFTDVKDFYDYLFSLDFLSTRYELYDVSAHGTELDLV